MSTAQNRAIRRYRARMKLGGWVRCEVHVRREDAPLVRTVAAMLADPTREAMARAVIRESFAEPVAPRLKSLLASAPLGDIELEPAPDADHRWTGR